MSYIKLDRKLLEWGWKDTPEMVALWVDILMEANWTPSEWHGVVYEEGTFPTSVEKLSINTGLSVRTIRTCLERLKKSGEIDIQTTNKGTKIIVNKWALYQGSCDDTDNPPDKQPTNNRQTTDNQSTTLKEYKEVKNKRNIYIRPTIDEVRAYCEERHSNVNPDKWFDYYSSNGWKVGKNPMKDWKACVRTWERNTNVRSATRGYESDTLPTYSTANNEKMSRSEEEELLRLMGRQA